MKNAKFFNIEGKLAIVLVIAIFINVNIYAQNVGIGITNPASKLHIYDGDLRIDDASDPFVLINSIAVNKIAGIQFQQNSSSSGWLYFNYSTNLMHLNTSTNGLRNDFIMNTSGNIGLGTASPSTKLHVWGGDITVENNNNSYLILNSTDASKDAGIKFQISGADTSWFYYDPVDNFLRMTTDVSGVRNDFGINGTGNVGIGTSLPEEELHVEGTIEVNQQIKAHDSGGLEFATDEGITRIKIRDNGNIGIGTSLPQKELHVEGTIEVNQQIKAHDIGGLELATDEGTIRIKIKDDGNVGIGATSPQAKLHIYGGEILLQSSNPFLNFKTTVSDGNSGLTFQEVGTYKGWITYNDASDVLRLSTGTSGSRDDLTINPSGRVGIGTASPGSHKLHVTSSGSGADGSTGYFINTAGDGIAMSLKNSSASSSDVVLLVSSLGTGDIARFDSYHGTGTWDPVFRFDNDGDGYCDGAWYGGGADYAEFFTKADAKEEIHPGDVIAMSPDKDYSVEKANASHNRLVLGVYSTNPVIAGNSSAEGNPENSVLVGMIGVVPTKVCIENGGIQIGDFLTVSGS